MAALSVRGLILKPAPALVSLAPSCNFASEVRPREINTAAMKRGRGGRSSFSGDVVTVFGSNGFIGTAIANRYRKLAKTIGNGNYPKCFSRLGKNG